MGSPVPAKSTLKDQTLLSVSRPRLTPLAAVPANPLGHHPPGRLPGPDWMGRAGTSCYQSGSPLLSHTHASPGAPAEPLLLAWPVPSPTPRALAATYRPGRCPSTGPAWRASGPAPTWRRSGQAGRRGWGADRALSGREGGQGEGPGEGETLSRWPLAASGRAEKKPEGLPKSPGCVSDDKAYRGRQ